MLIECAKCKEHFEIDDVQHGVTRIQCPKCLSKMKVTNKIAEHHLPGQYETYIDENQNLVIERKLFNWPDLFYSLPATLFIPFFHIYLSYKGEEHPIPTQGEPLLMFLILALPITLIGLYFTLNVCINKQEIVVGNGQIKISVYPIKLLPAQIINCSNVERIYYEKTYLGKLRERTIYRVYASRKAGFTALISQVNTLREADRLQELIEKRLEMEQLIEGSETLA